MSTDSVLLSPMSARRPKDKSLRLSPEEERVLVAAWRDRGDRRALARLVESERGLVEHLAHSFRRYGASFDDLVQEATVGLLEGIQRFDSERGLRLSTYAQHWIRAMLFDYVFRQRTLVRMGYGKARRLFFALGAERARIEGELGQGAERDQVDPLLAARFHTTEARIRDVSAHLSARDVSLDVPVGEDGAARVNLLVNPDPPSDELVARADHAERVRAVLDRMRDSLSPREILILEERLMAHEDDAASLATLGKRVGVTRERVRQIETRLVARLRKELEPLAEAG